MPPVEPTYLTVGQLASLNLDEFADAESPKEAARGIDVITHFCLLSRFRLAGLTHFVGVVEICVWRVFTTPSVCPYCTCRPQAQVDARRAAIRVQVAKARKSQSAREVRVEQMPLKTALVRSAHSVALSSRLWALSFGYVCHGATSSADRVQGTAPNSPRRRMSPQLTLAGIACVVLLRPPCSQREKVREAAKALEDSVEAKKGMILGKSQGEILRLLKAPSRSMSGTHVGVSCDACGAAPIVGYRWRCKYVALPGTLLQQSWSIDSLFVATKLVD